MTEIHIVFTTDRFNCSQPRTHYINECCYGDDLANWMAERLRPLEFRVGQPGQEDWGWYLRVWSSRDAYFVAIGAITLEEDLQPTPARGSNHGEWRIIVQKRRTLWKWLLGSHQISRDDPLVQAIERTLVTELDVKLTVSEGVSS